MMPIASPPIDRARHAAHAAEHDGGQRLEQRQVAHLRKDQEQRAEQRAAQRGERAPEREGEQEDAVGVDADDCAPRRDAGWSRGSRCRAGFRCRKKCSRITVAATTAMMTKCCTVKLNGPSGTMISAAATRICSALGPQSGDDAVLDHQDQAERGDDLHVDVVAQRGGTPAAPAPGPARPSTSHRDEHGERGNCRSAEEGNSGRHSRPP